ncbi:MAG TPA: AAA family ATPase [Roseiflexaceae bacterium]
MTAIHQPRQQALLAYVMLNASTPQTRQHLAFLFWPDSTERQAHANLRYTLHHLRRSFPPIDQYLQIGAQTLHWRPTTTFQLDVDVFEALVAAARRASGERALHATFQQAVDHYPGDLLPHCYDEWVIPIRERLHQLYLAALDQLVDLLEQADELRAALGYAERRLQHDTLREISYRRLMQLHALNGDRGSALRVYHDCAAMLERELGAAPGSDTRAVYARMLDTAPEPMPVSQAAPTTAATPRSLVGRGQELQELLAAWQAAAGGQSRLALLTGEAGIGKTRLAEELLAWVGQRGGATARTRAYAAEGRLAYALVADMLRAGIYHDRLAQLDDVWLTEVARLLPEILADRPALPQPQPLTDGWQRRRLFEALARAVLLADQPLLLLIDDLQWADQETLEWLHYLLRFAPEARLLVVGTARSEDIGPDHPLTALLLDLRRSGQVTEIALGPLDAAETAALARQIAATELDQPILDQLYAQTEGTPLFIVETVRAGLASSAFSVMSEETRSTTSSKRSTQNAKPWPEPGRRLRTQNAQLPPAIYAVIQYRLAQLSPAARELVAVAAVVGRSFTFAIIAHAGGGDEATLVRSLDELWQRRVVREHGAHAYDFSHDRIRDVAYAEIRPAQRYLLHRRVAQALEQTHAGTALDMVSSQVAVHYEQAGVPERAIPYYRRAGLVAQQVYAHREAIGHFTTALTLLGRLPGSPQHDADELDLQLALVLSIRVTRGSAAPELKPIHDRAWALCDQVGTPEQRFSVLFELCAFHHLRGETDQHQALAERLVDLAEQWRTPVHLVIACMLLGDAHFVRGKLMLAQEQFERCVSLYSAQQHHAYVASTGVDRGVISLAWESHALWCLGYPDQALQRVRKAIDLAHHLAHPISQIWALAYAAMLHQFRHESAAVRAEAETALALATQYEIAYYGAWAAILLAWALAEEQPGAEGIARLHQALADFQATGARLRWPYYLALLAEIYGSAGQPATGLSVLDEALAVSATHGECWWDAELHRLRGELLLAQGAQEATAAAAFQQALAIARDQGARSLELRAATSLGRLWQRQGRVDQAHRLLSDMYTWFTEGFETPDLQAARALLHTL